MIIFAEGMNPDTDEHWYDEKRRFFGGDDGAQTLPSEWMNSIMRSDATWVDFIMSEKQIEMIFGSQLH